MVGGGSWWELLIPAGLVALFPVIEWVHPRRRSCTGGRAASARSTIDSLLARKHREHHADPRDLPLVFIPWQVLVWLLPAYVVVALLAVPSASAALDAAGVGLRADVRLRVDPLPDPQRLPAPVARAYRAVWRNHRLHHYKNEHYWFTVTTAGTADRLFGTYPDPETVPTSPTAKNLHGAADSASRTAQLRRNTSGNRSRAAEPAQLRGSGGALRGDGQVGGA